MLPPGRAFPEHPNPPAAAETEAGNQRRRPSFWTQEPPANPAGVEAGRGREASPLLPGGRRRRGPAVAKDEALPGHGWSGRESDGGPRRPKLST